MKYLITTLGIFVIFICNGQISKQGDNLSTELKKIARPDYFAAPGSTGWTEGANMLLIGTNEIQMTVILFLSHYSILL